MTVHRTTQTHGPTPEQQANQGNQRAQKTRDWRSCARRAWIPAMASRSATATPMPPALRSPKIEASEAAKVLMGELRPRLPEPSSFNPKLEVALERWKKAAEGQGLFTRFASDAASAVV